MKKIVIALTFSFASFSLYADYKGRPQQMSLPLEIYKPSAEFSFAKYVEELKEKELYVVPNDRSQKIFETLKAQVIQDYPHSKTWFWMFFGNEDMEFDAVGGVYGKVVLGTNLFNESLFNDDELAFVIAHELAHSIREHGREKFQKEKLSGYSKLNHIVEYEADRIAVELLKKTDFDIIRGAGYLLKMKNYYDYFGVEQGGENSSHPPIVQRYLNLLSYLNF